MDIIDNRPVGIFDSGIGGFTVLHQLKQLLPRESFIYVADNANRPFGDKSLEEILQINDKIISYLLNKDVKMIVIACNTSSALALEYDKRKYPIPFVDMLKDGLWFAKTLNYKAKVAVLATQATVNSLMYLKILKQSNPTMFVEQQACPLLVPLIERHIYDGNLKVKDRSWDKDIEKAILDYTSKFKGFDYIITGCSHYPYINSYLSFALPKTQIIDPAYYVSLRTKEIIRKSGANKELKKYSFNYTKEDDIIISNAKAFGFDDLKKIKL